ncbi:MAG: F0F1 ATP synthase subunit A [Bilifractor sp.]
MNGEKKKKSIVLFIVLVAVLFVGIILTEPMDKGETLKESMRDVVMHESNKVSLFGLIDVNPGLISAYVVTAILFVFSLIVRIAVIPKFKYVPGKFQMMLEQAVGLFRKKAEDNSPTRNNFLGAYIFMAGVYIFVGTLFELFGFQVITTTGRSVSLPAPLADMNGAICMACLSYGVIMSGGIAGNKGKGILYTLKEYSLPISMSFRLFGALLSGALVTELVYSTPTLSIGLPVLVGVLFTLLHALIQAYVLTMLTSVYYGQVTVTPAKKEKKKRRNR